LISISVELAASRKNEPVEGVLAGGSTLMHRLSKIFVATALTILALGSPALAESTVVRVALIDMSAAMPGTGPFAGMMGSGMGFGMMWPGMMGRGGLGPGMMMGMMSLRTDKTSVKAGPVTFDVTNWSRSVVHEMLVVAVDSPDAPLPYDYSKQIVLEDQIKKLGETQELQPNTSKTIDMTLAPGSYLLVCNVPGHYAAGMVAPFTVAP
jgi:uncharacterized cupredoxin-like copper-binding protein